MNKHSLPLLLFTLLVGCQTPQTSESVFNSTTHPTSFLDIPFTHLPNLPLCTAEERFQIRAQEKNSATTPPPPFSVQSTCLEYEAHISYQGGYDTAIHLNAADAARLAFPIRDLSVRKMPDPSGGFIYSLSFTGQLEDFALQQKLIESTFGPFKDYSQIDPNSVIYRWAPETETEILIITQQEQGNNLILITQKQAN